MSTNVPMPSMRSLETSILADVAEQFAKFWKSTSRYLLVIKYEGQPAGQVIANLVSRNIIRKTDFNRPTDDEEYVPTASAFELCENPESLKKAKISTTVALHTLKQMFKGERKQEGFTFEDFQRHVSNIYPDKTFDSEELRLGLYLAKDFNVLSSYSSGNADWRNVAPFRIAETAIAIADPEEEWDRVMSNLKPRITENIVTSPTESWEVIESLGGGGQSDVFLVRSPARVSERARYLQIMQAALNGGKAAADFADAIQSYSRPDADSELGAKKIFKIRSDGGEVQALERMKQEFQILAQSRPGLPKLLDSNESERWIVTEYFPNRTLEHNILKYRGNSAFALKAFLTLVKTVAQLHEDHIVHRDIKPANVFVRHDDALVLGDFGIVYLPDKPARPTMMDERVGPRDYMPQWGDLGERLENVQPNFDVYMLGKLLWCMISGRLKLPREYHTRSAYDLSVLFPDDPTMRKINEILGKCLVEEPEQCLKSAKNLIVPIEDALAAIQKGVPMLDSKGNLTLPCRVCGKGFYKEHRSVQFYVNDQMSRPLTPIAVRMFVCNVCTHYELFAPNFPEEAAKKNWNPWLQLK